MAHKFLGWARGQDARGDETGVWHALVIDGNEAARAACTRHQRHAGQVEPLPVGAPVCRRIGCNNMRREQQRARKVATTGACADKNEPHTFSPNGICTKCGTYA